MIIRYDKAICVMILPLFLTGCWDYKDIEERTIGISIGIDYINGEIENTGEKAKPSSSTPGKSSMAQLTETYKFKAFGRNFEKVRSNFEAQVPAPNFAGATKAFIISKRFAEIKGLEGYMNRYYFTTELRSSSFVVICNESADEFFSKKIENDISIGHGVSDTISYLHENGMAIYRTVQDIQSDIQFGNIGYLIPYVTNRDDTIKYLGFAVMKDSKLIGIVERAESKGFLMVLSKKSSDTSAIPSPSNDKTLISIRSRLAKRSIKTSYQDDKINIYIDLKLKSEIIYQYNIEPISKQDIKKLEETIASKIKKDVLSAVNRSQKEFGSDVFGFGRYFKAENPTVYKQIDWIKEYPRAIFHVNVNATIIHNNLFDPNAKKTD